MSKKYVPIFLRKSEQDKELVNTSLPAKEVIPLAPATLASITGGGAAPKSESESEPTTTFSIRSMRAAKVAPVLSADDFPSLTAKPAKAVATAPTAWTTSFASLAGKWATEQKEQEELARTDAARRASIEAEERRAKAELEKGMRALGAVGATSYYGQRDASSFLSDEEREQEKERQRRMKELMEEDAKYNRMVEEEESQYTAEDWEWRRRSKHDF